MTLINSSSMTEAEAAFDPIRFRDTLGHYASGVTVVTTELDGMPVGFTCQSFYSVSLEPPLVSFSVMKTSTSYPAIRQSGKFTVNVLAQHQSGLSGQFAKRGDDKWAGVLWSETRQGNPVLDGCLMWIDCQLEQEIEAGDHYIVVGRVVQLSEPESLGNEPLLFFKGRYRQLADE